MHAHSSFHRVLLSGFLMLISAIAYADSTEIPKQGSLTVKEHIIRWMLTDQKFIEKVALGGRAEIELSQLALSKAQASQVRSFAKTLVQDYIATDTELRVIAQSKNFTLPAALDHGHQDEVDLLKDLSDSQFDAAYINLMRQDHENAVSLFSAAANDEKLAPELRQFAQKTLPILRLHQQHAQALAAASAATVSSTLAFHRAASDYARL